MEQKTTGDIDVTTDVIIPAIIIVCLFLFNGIILYIIFKKRQSVVYEEYDTIAREEANTNLQSRIQAGGLTASQPPMPDNEEGIEMERL